MTNWVVHRWYKWYQRKYRRTVCPKCDTKLLVRTLYYNGNEDFSYSCLGDDCDWELEERVEHEGN